MRTHVNKLLQEAAESELWGSLLSQLGTVLASGRAPNWEEH